MALPMPTKSLTTFLSLNALQCDRLAQLIMGSIAYKQGGAGDFESTAEEAIKICEQTLNILHTIQIQTKELHIQNTRMKLSTGPNRLSSLPHDGLFYMCDYLDSFSKAHLRFTSMTTHIDMMGCPLDLTQTTKSRYMYKEVSPHAGTPSIISLVSSYVPMRIIRRQPKNSCGCVASRQLQLIDIGTVEVNQAFCNDLTESQLSLLGIGRSWSITGIKVKCDDTAVDFMEMCDIVNKHDVFRSVKRLDFSLSHENIDVIGVLETCIMAGSIEYLSISGEYTRRSIVESMSCSISLSSFKRLRCIDIEELSIDISLNDFLKYSPQIEELRLIETDITGDISCLAQLKNIKVFVIDAFDYAKCVYGDISSLSSCTKLTVLDILSDVTGNISSLTTLTNLISFSLQSTGVKGKIESLLKYLPKLNSLTLYSNDSLKGELLLTENTELEYLDINGQMDMHLDISSLMHLKKLKRCCIDVVSHFIGDISVMSGLTKLNSLRIEGCPQITGCINSLATLPNLDYVELGYSTNTTGDPSLFSHIPRSYISCCDNIKD